MARVRALVVDDSKVMRLMVMKALRQSRLADFEIDEAEDGAKGLETIQAGDYEIVFADINMPNMNGIEMVRIIREEGKHVHLRIVMVTSEKTAEKVDEAVNQAGADAFISKPFNVEQLQETLGPIVEGLQADRDDRSSLFSELVKG